MTIIQVRIFHQHNRNQGKIAEIAGIAEITEAKIIKAQRNLKEKNKQLLLKN